VPVTKRTPSTPKETTSNEETTAPAVAAAAATSTAAEAPPLLPQLLLLNVACSNSWPLHVLLVFHLKSERLRSPPPLSVTHSGANSAACTRRSLSIDASMRCSRPKG
jgi:hypothetical protein